MNDVQIRIAELHAKGWTFVNIARAIGQSDVTVESWNAGIRSPANLQSVLASLDRLAAQKRVPKKKIYGQRSKVTDTRVKSEGGNNDS